MRSLVSGGKKKKSKLPEFDAVRIKTPVQNDIHVSAQVPFGKFVNIGPYISGNLNTGKVNGGGLAFTLFPPKKN